MKRVILPILAGVCLLGGAHAQVILNDGNARATINHGNTGVLGMNSWLTDGQDNLYQQWYWFRVGQNPEAAINTISAATITGQTNNSVNIAYGNNQLRVDITFTLIGGTPGSGTSDIAEVIRVTNLSGTALDFHLFEYDDFDLGTAFNDDLAELVNSSTIRQYDASVQAMVGTVPLPDAWEIAASGPIFNRLNDNMPSNLNNTGSPFGPGDATFAFQWNRVIAPGSAFVMSKNKLITPEPGTFVAIGAGLALLFARRRRK